MADNNEAFEALECLGVGGFAETWHARVVHPDLAEKWGSDDVAIKIPRTIEHEITLQSESETNVVLKQARSLHSENIAKYLGVWRFKNRLVLVMKYYKNGNLRSLLGGKIGRWKTLPSATATDLTRKVLSGLELIHGLDIVHRDIKPENILMDGETPAIADFGIARVLNHSEAISQRGTLQYMSPELIRDGKAKHNTDIWSLGVTFYEMLCGRYPFGITVESPLDQLVSLIKNEGSPLAFPAELGIPKSIQEVVTRMLERDPARRYATAHDALEDIERRVRVPPAGLETIDIVGPPPGTRSASRESPSVSSVTPAALPGVQHATPASAAAGASIPGLSEATARSVGLADQAAGGGDLDGAIALLTKAMLGVGGTAWIAMRKKLAQYQRARGVLLANKAALLMPGKKQQGEVRFLLSRALGFLQQARDGDSGEASIRESLANVEQALKLLDQEEREGGSSS